MFGYINVSKDKLTDNQYACYKAIYCSLCKTMGREYSVMSRFILSYDCTFYAMLIMSFENDEAQFSPGRCPFNPLTKTNYCNDDIALSLAAALSISSAYYKLIDNIRDSSFFKRSIYRILLPLFKRWNKKVIKRFPDIDKTLSDMMEYQEKVESGDSPILDQACDPTAMMLSKMCGMIPSYISSDILDKSVSSKRVLESFGYFLGRWIYLIDAADDYEKDLKNGNFNPFIIRYRDKFDKRSIENTLNHCLSEMMLSYELLDKGRYDILVSNVLFLGLPAKQKEVLKISDRSKQEDNT